MPVKDEHKKTLEQHSQGNKFIYSSYDNVTQEMVQEANVIIGNVDPFYLQEAKNLEWLQLNSAGADPYVKKGVLPEDVILTNATGAYGPSVAEHMLAVLFSLQKKLHLYRDNQNQCEWQDEGGVMSLCGGTLLIVGLGDIGLYFARLMKNFDYHIIGIKRRPGQVPQDIDELHTMDDLDKLLPKADVVRKYYECGNIALFIKFADENDIAELENCYNRMKNCNGDMQEFYTADYEFHEVLAKGTKKEFVYRITKSISKALIRHHEKVNLGVGPDIGLEYHKYILKYVKERDVELATLYMRKHMEETMQRMEKNRKKQQ